MVRYPIVVALVVAVVFASTGEDQRPKTEGTFPVVGATSGAFGARFATELQLNNRSNRFMSGRLIFRPAGTPGTDLDPSIHYEIEPHATLRFADVMREIDAEGIGSLDLQVAEGGVPTMVARAFDDRGSEGTAGAIVPYLASEDSLTSGGRAILIVPADLARTRFNVGVRSLEEPARIRVSILGANGIAQRTFTRDYPADYFLQESGEVFARGALLPNEVLEIEVLEGRAILYGTTTDNLTNDPSLALATLDESTQTGDEPRAVVPVVGSTAGAFDSLFRTEMQIHNPVDTTITGHLIFLPAGGSAAASVSLPYEIGPRQTIVHEDVVEAIGASGLGSLDVIPDQGPVPVIAVRAFDDGEQGTTGTSLPALDSNDPSVWLETGDRTSLVIPADLEHFRFNIGVRTLAHTEMQVTVFDASGERVHETTRAYPADWFSQEPGGPFAGTDLPAGGSVVVQVSGGKALLYGTTVDNRTNDPAIQLGHKLNLRPRTPADTIDLELDPDEAAQTTIEVEDPENDPLMASVVAGPSNGTVEIEVSEDGGFVVIYTPEPGYLGPDRIIVAIDDGDGGTAFVTINVLVRNDEPPVATDDSVTTPEDQRVSIELAGSGSGALQFAIGERPRNGVLTSLVETSPTTASVIYTPDRDFNGSDVFVFTITDDEQRVGEGTISVTVTPVNDPPTAGDVTLSTFEDVPVDGNVVASDADGDPLLFSVVTSPVNGSVVLTQTTGAFTYTPVPGFGGGDEFTVRVSDGQGGSVLVTVRVTVSPTNDLPVVDLDADNDRGTTGLDTTAVYTEGSAPVPIADPVDAVINDPDSPVLTSLVVTLTNLLDPGFELLDVDLTVVPGTAITKSFAQAGGEGVLTLSGPAPIAEFESLLRAITYVNTSEDPDPTVRIIELVANDGSGDGPPAVSRVSVVAVNDAPVAQDRAESVLEDSSLALTLTASDPEGDALTWSIATAPANGSLTGSGPGYTYTPTPDFNGSDSFLFEVRDPDGAIDTATVSITVDPVNDAPSFIVGSDQTVLEDAGPQTVPGWATVISPGPPDEAGQTLTFNVTGSTNPSLFALGPSISSDGALSYTPAAEASGAATFTLVLVDDGGVANGGADTSLAATFDVNVTAVDDPPSFTSGTSASIFENTTAVMTVTAVDPDGDPITYSITGGADQTLFGIGAGTGVLAFNTAPNFESPLDANLDNIYLVEVTATANGVSTAQTISVTVNDVNEAPLIVNDAYDTAGNTDLAAGGAVSPAVAAVTDATNVLANDGDPEGVGLTVVAETKATSAGGTVTINADGSFVYTPPPDPFTVADSFIYVASDGVTPVQGTVNVTLYDTVWYVDSSAPGPGDGTSADPFTTLAAAEAASGPGHTIYVLEGNSGTTPYLDTIALRDGQRLLGQAEDLVVTINGVPTTLVTGSAATTPVVAPPAGDAVTIEADGISGPLLGIEVRGLEIRSSQSAVLATTTTNPIEIALSTLTLSGSGVDPALLVSKIGADPATVREIRNLTVMGSAPGIQLLGATLDSDATTAGAQQVSGGTLVIGSPGARTGRGLELNCADGDLHFASVTIYSANGGALEAGACGSPLSLNVDSGVVDSTGAAALFLDGLNLGVTLDSLSSDAAPSEVSLVNLSGAFSATTTSIQGHLADGVAIEGSSADFTFGSLTIDDVVGRGLVLTNNTGAIQVNGGVIGETVSTPLATGATAVDIDQAQGDVTIAASITNTAGRSIEITNSGGSTANTISFTAPIDDTGQGIVLDNNDVSAGATVLFSGGLALATGADAGMTATNGGTVSVSSTGVSTTITNGTGVGLFFVDASVGAAGVTFDSLSTTGAPSGIILSNVNGGPVTLSGGSIAGSTTAAIDITGGTSAVSSAADLVNSVGHDVVISGHTGGAVDISGNLSGPGSRGIDVTGSAGTISFSGAVKTLNTGANAAVTLASNSGATINFSNGGLDIDTTSGVGFTASGGGTINISGAGNSITSTSGQALDMNGVTAGMTFGSVASTGSAAEGIDLDNVAGTVTVTGATTIVSPVSTGVDVRASTGTFSFGDLDITTTNQTGLFASNVGTINSTSGTVSTGTAPGVDIDNSALGMTLTSVSSSGGTTPGIDLETTTGSFSVVGDGLDTTLGGNGSGGTISAKTGADGFTGNLGTGGPTFASIDVTQGVGVRLIDASNVSLRRMNLNDHSNYAIFGRGVSGFDLDYSTVDGVNGTSNAQDEGSVRLVNLTGSASVLASLIEGAFEDNLNVMNDGGVLDRLTVQNSTIGLNATATGGDGIFVGAQNNATVNFTVSGSTFNGARDDMVHCNALGTSTLDCVVRDNTFDNVHTGFFANRRGVTISGGDATSNINVTYDVSGTTPGAQTFNGTFREAIRIVFGGGSGVASGSIRNNAIGTAGVFGSGTASDSATAGIAVGELFATQNVSQTVSIVDNVVRETKGAAGIAVIANAAVGLNATITGNDVQVSQQNHSSNGSFNAFWGVVEDGTACLLLRNNTFDASGAPLTGEAIRFNQTDPSANFNFPQYLPFANGEDGSGCAAGTASFALSNHLSSGNTLINGPVTAVPFLTVNARSVCGVTGAGTSCP